MFEVISLASGSAGNSLLVRGASSAFIVDAGLSAKQLTTRLQTCGMRVEDLTGILLTHEHGDHTSALKVLLAKQGLPVYCNPLTARALTDSGLTHKNWQFFQNGSEFAMGEFTVCSFSVPHDAIDPVGFRIAAKGAAFGVLTDLGYATKLVFEMLRGIHALMIETNYDADLLQRDMKRPWSVKQRIVSRHGHLSNAGAAKVIEELDAPELRHIILGHLSKDCNAPHLAEGAIKNSLQTLGREAHITLHCAAQNELSPVHTLI